MRNIHPRPSGRPSLPLLSLLLLGLLLPAWGSSLAAAEDDAAGPQDLGRISGAVIRANAAALDTASKQERGPTTDALTPRDAWIAARFEAAGLAPRGKAYGWTLPAALPQARHAHVLGVLAGADEDLRDEVVLLLAPSERTVSAALLAHLAEAFQTARPRPRRSVVFASLGARGDDAGRQIAAHLKANGAIVAALLIDEIGAGDGPLHVDGVGAYPAMRARLEGLLPKTGKDVVFRRGDGSGCAAAALRARGIPAFRATAGASAADGKAPAPADDGKLERVARMVATLALGLAQHPEPLRDPQGVASFLVCTGPRFSVDDLIEEPAGNFRLARERIYPRRTIAGLAAVVVNVSEDLDPATALQALEKIAAAEGPVRFRVARRVADIEQAFLDGAVALLPRLCCARGAHSDPTYLASAAALGYRWIAPWSTATRRKMTAPLVAPIVAAARMLPVILDAGDLPLAQHRALRTALGGRRALFLNLDRVQGKELGREVLPLVRFHTRTPWAKALETYPGMAPPVVYKPRVEPLIEAITAWGKQQPAGWDEPGSPQRKALRAALGGSLLTWLRSSEP